MKINKNMDAQKTKRDWHLVDWNQPTSVIAEQTGLSQSYISGRRRKYAPQTVWIHHTKKYAMRDSANGIDWTKTDWQISKETGRSHGSIWKTRQKLFSGKKPVADSF